jgi:hypothetical protein
MKNLILLIVSIVTLSSCVKYAEPQLLSLSGMYVIDQIIDQDNNVYNVGDTLKDSSDLVFLTTDTITNYLVGDTIFEMDYSMIRTDPNPVSGGIYWSKEYYYVVHGQLSVYDYGYIYFNCNGTRRIWKILDDQSLSMTFRTEQNSDGNFLVFKLTRIAP